MGLFDAEKNKILNHVLRGVTHTGYTTLYVALLKSAPTDTMDGSDVAAIEADYTGYVRTSLTVGTTAFDAAALGVTQNGGTIAFPEVTGATHDVSHFAIINGAVGDDTDELVFWGPLGSTDTLAVGNTPVFETGTLIFTL